MLFIYSSLHSWTARNFSSTNLCDQKFPILNVHQIFSLQIYIEMFLIVEDKNKLVISFSFLPFCNQIYQLLDHIVFNNSVGETVCFNSNREIRGGFDIINLVIFPNNSLHRVKIGKVQHYALAEEEFVTNETLIVWHRNVNQVWSFNIFGGYFIKQMTIRNCKI